MSAADQIEPIFHTMASIPTQLLGSQGLASPPLRSAGQWSAAAHPPSRRPARAHKPPRSRVAFPGWRPPLPGRPRATDTTRAAERPLSTISTWARGLFPWRLEHRRAGDINLAHVISRSSVCILTERSQVKATGSSPTALDAHRAVIPRRCNDASTCPN